MKHLLICREYPPAPYPAGGIGTYAANITRLLVARGETVHVIAQRSRLATLEIEVALGGRLVVHRIRMEPGWGPSVDRVARRLFASPFPPQAFAWRAALLAERLIASEEIDVVEGQDWEAPLYFLQARRAQGLGPERRPPLLVHLHSPTEMIVAANSWDPARPDRVTAAQLEEYSIRSADGWVSPSRFMAAAVADRYEIPREVIDVIPYPVAHSPLLSRARETWTTGPISYLGRMEHRKGVLEWVEAAVDTARHVPAVQFEFAGPDSIADGGWSMRRVAEALVPTDLTDRFTFHGELGRDEIARLLGRSRMAVVPSRWDNLPNTCLEAMESGLPVLSTESGGMSEVIVDGETGWLTEKPTVAGLVTGLRRALDCPPSELAAMGAAASASVRRLCDPEAVADAHVRHRHRIVNQGSTRSSRTAPPLEAHPEARFVPSQHGSGVRAVLSLPVRQQLGLVAPGLRHIRQGWLSPSAGIESAMRLGPGLEGLVSVVVIFLNDEEFLSEALDSVFNQSYPDWELLLVDDGSEKSASELALSYVERSPGQVRYLEHPGHTNRGEAASRNLGTRHSRGEFVAFLDADDLWLPDKLARQVEIMREHPEVAMVYGSNKKWFSWTGTLDDSDRDYVRIGSVPVDTVVAPPRLLKPLIREAEHPSPSDVLFRREALDRLGGHDEGSSSRVLYEDSRLFAKVFLSEFVFKSSETWDLYRVRPGSMAREALRTGEMRQARLDFLVWLTHHMHQRTVDDVELPRVLKEAVRTAQRMVAEDPWRLYVGGTCRADLVVNRPHARVNITRADTGVAWDIQLNARQRGVANGDVYVLRFAARADRRREIQVGVARLDAHWDGLGLYETVSLSSTWARYQWEFIASGDADVTRVHFDLGLDVAPVEVKDVELLHQGRWTLHRSGLSRAVLIVGSDHGRARVEIGESDSFAATDVQLNKRLPGIRSEQSYVLSFEARADIDRSVFVGAARAAPPWEGLGLYAKLELTREWKRSSFAFVATDDADSARIHFDLGEALAAVEVRDVALVEGKSLGGDESDVPSAGANGALGSSESGH